MARCEAIRFALSAVVESVASGAIEVGTATPVVAPLCVALLKVKGVVDEANRSKEELEELCEWCDLITVKVIHKAKASQVSTFDVAPLKKCIDKLEDVADRYNSQGGCAKLARFRRNRDDIQRLRSRILAVVPILGLAGVVDLLAYQRLRQKLAPVPKKAPITKSWHVTRDGKVDKVCKILGGDGGPALAALTGRSGAGKTTAAAAMVGERGPVRPDAGETEDEARARLDRVRALFPDGVVWLRVGKGKGSADQLPALMLKLAIRVREDVLKESVDAPAAGENGERYLERIVSQESLRCLVVADDVWEVEVVEKLRKTGMWVLLTTRTASMVQPHETVVMDTLTEAEAEDVLRGAAELPPGERLCESAKDILKICGRVAMDIAFVGSWSPVRAADGIPKSSKAWAGTLEKIEAQIDEVRGQALVANTSAWEIDGLDVNRLAVLRAGFKYLGREDPLAQELYAALAVFADGHSFGESESVVLLGNEEDATGPLSILERWGVIEADTSGRYRMHDAHVNFARNKLLGWEHVRKPSVDRWTVHISRLDVAVGIGVYPLLSMWRMLERVGGEGWWAYQPYDDQLVGMDDFDCSKILAVTVVAELFVHDRKFRKLEALMKRVLEHCNAHEGGCREVQMTALYYTRHSLISQGLFQESKDITRRLGDMAGPSTDVQVPRCGTSVAQTATTFHTYGVCAKAAGRLKSAEEYFRQALKVQEEGGSMASSQMVSTLHGLGTCLRDAGRLQEAAELFKRALAIKEAKLGADHVGVAYTLHKMGVCARKAGRLGEAEELFQRALRIKEAKLGANDLGVAWTLHDMGQCVREAERLEEAEKLFRRALKIREAKLGNDDPKVARALHELGICLRQAGQLEEAEELLRRALKIQEATLGPDDSKTALTVHELGVCVQAWPDQSAELSERALKVGETKLS
eukprot:g15008.t1